MNKMRQAIGLALPQARKNVIFGLALVILAGATFPEICEGGESQKSQFLIWGDIGVRGTGGYFQGCWCGWDNDVQARRQPQKFPLLRGPS